MKFERREKYKEGDIVVSDFSMFARYIVKVGKRYILYRPLDSDLISDTQGSDPMMENGWYVVVNPDIELLRKRETVGILTGVIQPLKDLGEVNNGG